MSRSGISWSSVLVGLSWICMTWLGLFHISISMGIISSRHVHAEVAVPTVISNNMVLQRAPQSAVIWGTADPFIDGIVVVSLDGIVNLNATVSSSGTWSVTLPPQAATKPGTSHTITIAGNVNYIKLVDILFGDVWLCSGQSNMEMTISDAFNGSKYIADSRLYTGIRYFTMQKTPADTPQTNETSKDPKHLWGLSEPDVVGGATWTTFSATCYFFGIQLYSALGGQVPLGLVASNWGGTQIEAWSSPDALAVCADAATGKKMEHVNDKNDDAIEFGSDLVSDSQLYNGMIAPLLNMRFTGVTWYQGEQNAGAPLEYACQFPAMISDWRIKFNNPRLYFYFVMLAALPPDDTTSSYPAMRQAQLSALTLPHVGMALAVDLGDPTSPLGAIHPRNKPEVGRRLFLAAWADAYGQDIVSSGARVSSIDFPGTGYSPDNSTFLIHYSPGPSGDGLILKDSEACSTCCSQTPAYQIKTKYSDWTYGVVTVSPSLYRVGVSLSSISVSNPPTGIRYAYIDYPECILWNDSKLPAVPFQQLY